MKKNIIGAIIALLLLFFAIGWAIYDLRPVPPTKPREYQVEIDQDSIHVYSGDRRIGTFAWDTSAFSKILLNDNK